MNRSYKFWTTKELKSARRAHARGTNWRRIARRLGRSRSSVKNAVQREIARGK